MFKRVKSKKLTDSANGQHCTMRVPGICNGRNDTVVLCHIPRPKMSATGGKTHDFFGFYGCSDCHTWFDRYSKNAAVSFEYALDALLETQSIMVLQGLIKIEGATL